MAARTQLAIGMDVGSTTVKAVVVDPTTKAILWSDYQRHNTKQPEYVLSMMQTILGARGRLLYARPRAVSSSRK
jgi:activator of 2-hydroxyglutaryl-CoA dehydratase